MRIVVRSSDYGEAHAVSGFREDFGRRMLGLEVVAEDPTEFSATTIVQPIGMVLGSSIAANRTTFERNRLNDGDGNASLMWVRDGEMRADTRNTTHSVGQGHLLLISHEEQASVYLGRNSVLDGVLLPRALLEHGLSRVGRSLFGTYDQNNPIAAVLKAYVTTLLSSDPARTIGFQRLSGGHVADLITALLMERAGEPDPRAESESLARFEQICRAIDKQALDHSLTIHKLSTQFQLSLRSLNAIFARFDTTVADEIRHARLKHARRLLLLSQQGRQVPLKIAEIAFAAGFNDVTTFNRAYLRQFGERPSDTREK